MYKTADKITVLYILIFKYVEVYFKLLSFQSDKNAFISNL